MNANMSIAALLSDNKRLLSTGQVARILGISEVTLRRWRSQGIGPRYMRMGNKRGCAIRYLQADVTNWMAAHAFGGEGEVRHV